MLWTKTHLRKHTYTQYQNKHIAIIPHAPTVYVWPTQPQAHKNLQKSFAPAWLCSTVPNAQPTLGAAECCPQSELHLTACCPHPASCKLVYNRNIHSWLYHFLWHCPHPHPTCRWWPRPMVRTCILLLPEVHNPPHTTKGAAHHWLKRKRRSDCAMASSLLSVVLSPPSPQHVSAQQGTCTFLLLLPELHNHPHTTAMATSHHLLSY